MPDNNLSGTDANSQYQEILNRYQEELKNTSPPPIPPKPVPSPPQPPLSPPPVLTNDTPSSLPPKESIGIFKFLFFISLLIFVGVIFAIGYSLINQPAGTTNPVKSLPSVSPTAPSSASCELNDKKYQVGESFTAADNCNTCTCLEDLTISCTELDCSLTPALSPSSSPEKVNN